VPYKKVRQSAFNTECISLIRVGAHEPYMRTGLPSVWSSFMMTNVPALGIIVSFTYDNLNREKTNGRHMVSGLQKPDHGFTGQRKLVDHES